MLYVIGEGDMRSRKTIFELVPGILAALLLAVSTTMMFSQAQTQQQQSDQTESSSQAQSTAPEKKPNDAATAQTPTNQAPSPEEARQAQFLADSQKLYQLAQELKAEVAKSNKNTLSIAVTKKAEEIEKLAKNLKERMRKEQ
jgi:ABC-type Na+ efflux pump permease subunit